MTEAEWLACEDPTPMVDFIEGKASPRKLRLFLVACARLAWDHIAVPEAREAVEVAERYADGLAPEEERDRIAKLLWSVERLRGQPREYYRAYNSAQLTVHRPAPSSRITSRATWMAARRATGAQWPDLLREIFGNPFRPVAFSPEWRTDTAVSLARQMYEARDFGAMPTLADALQDAGCDDEVMLGRCRAPSGVHCRGNWVVDLVLGRE